ncbi:mersacidin/lichenicidin family type 2 lantibiotic [bacterium]|nr:MAG: mersacidin/lichenicidin family type 2 lantibiotic [bacterium]
MNSSDVIRAWKDEDFRSTLSSEQLAMLPANPAGLVELSDEELLGVEGGTSVVCTILVTVILVSLVTCNTTINSMHEGC